MALAPPALVAGGWWSPDFACGSATGGFLGGGANVNACNGRGAIVMGGMTLRADRGVKLDPAAAVEELEVAPALVVVVVAVAVDTGP